MGGTYTPNSGDLNFITYTPLREADIMWNKRIWRVLDLKEKINHPLYFPIDAIPSRTSFMQMVMAGLTCFESEYVLTGYDIIDDE